MFDHSPLKVAAIRAGMVGPGAKAGGQNGTHGLLKVISATT
jgi:hypothetical protein